MRTGYVRQFRRWPCDKQIAYLLEKGVPRKHIYVEGSGAETLAAAIRATRKGEYLEVVALRAFGDSLRKIRKAYEQLLAKGAGVIEATTDRKSSDFGIPLYHDAHRALHGEASAGSKAEMSRRGSKGGKLAAAKHELKRMPASQARQIWRKSESAAVALEQMWGWTKPTAYRVLGRRT